MHCSSRAGTWCAGRDTCEGVPEYSLQLKRWISWRTHTHTSQVATGTVVVYSIWQLTFTCCIHGDDFCLQRRIAKSRRCSACALHNAHVWTITKMASISRIARCGSRLFSAGSRTSATGRGKTLVFCCREMFLRSAASPGRGYSTAGSATLRRAGVSVGALLAGSAVAYGGSLLFRREGSPSIVPAIQAGTHAHQPSVSEACTHYHLHTSSSLHFTLRCYSQ